MIKNEIGREQEEKTKGGIVMKKLILVMMVVGLAGMLAGTVRGASTDSADINLLVTPVITVTLNVSPTYYDFGNVDVQITTCSITALTLSNDGTVGILLEKAVWNDDDWDIEKSSTVQDGFDMWAMTKETQPGQSEYTDPNDKFVKLLLDAGYNELYNRTDGQQEDLDSEETKDLWFRLDMPKYVTNTDQKTIQVRIKATSKGL